METVILAIQVKMKTTLWVTKLTQLRLEATFKKVILMEKNVQEVKKVAAEK